MCAITVRSTSVSRGRSTLLLPRAAVLAMACAGVAAEAVGAARAKGTWPHWRGPHYNGSSPEAGLPVSWSTTERVAWVMPLPGADGSTPAVWGQRVFVSATDPKSKSLLAITMETATGRIIGRARVGATGKPGHKLNTNASPSPVTDGQRAYFVYGTGDLAAVGFDGSRRWSRDLKAELGEFHIRYGYTSGPLVHKGVLYIAVIQQEPPAGDLSARRTGSLLLGLDPASGRTIWKQNRPTQARGNAREAYTSPVLYGGEGHEQILLAGGDCLTGHDAATGAERWRWSGYNEKRNDRERIVASPVPGAGLIYTTRAYGKRLFAVRVDGQKRLGSPAVAWQAGRPLPDVCTPALYRGRLYVLDGRSKKLSCLDAETGQKKWEERIGQKTKYYTSPVAADGKVYCIDDDGNVTVIRAGDSFKVLARNRMGEAPCRASFAVAGGRLFIRTGRRLYCIR